MKDIDFNILKFREFYKKKNFDEASKLLIKLKNEYPLHPQFIKLKSQISSFEPSEKTKNKLRDEFSKDRFISVVNATGTLLNQTPYSLWLLHVIGLAFTKLNKYDEAYAAFDRLLFLNATHEGGLTGLANLFYQTNQTKKAAESFRKSIKHNGEKTEILCDLALAEDGSQMPQDALGTINRALKLDSDNMTAKRIKALIFRNLGRLTESQTLLKELIQKDSNDYDAIHTLATVYRDTGNYADAEKLLRKCVFADTDNLVKTKSIYTLSNFKSLKLDDEIINEAHSLLNDNKVDEKEKSDIYFALYAFFNKVKKYDEAFQYLKLGNDLRDKLSVFSMTKVIQNGENIKKYFIDNSKQINAYKAPDSLKHRPTPIFILGMPRSGTTLVESIFSQNSNVRSLGELTFLDTITIQKSSIRDVSEFFDTVSHLYFEMVDNYHNVQSTFFVDKMPSNFRLLGVIAKAFPDCHIIHMDRSPQAVCWSQYKTSFGSSGQDYSYDLDKILQYYNMYCNLMRFWTDLYGDRIININYENMVDNPKEILSPVCERLGIAWKDEYLDYHKKGKLIKTASKEQANKPIYKGSSEEWLNYETYLDTFKDLKRYYET